MILALCRWINCTIEIIGDDGREWGEIYDNMTGVGIIGNVLMDRADLGISKETYLFSKIILLI